MAKMIPKSLEYYSPTESERMLLNNLEQQLPNEYTVFYSIRWDSERYGDSECDILIFNPDLGIITIEVKGGSQIAVKNGIYSLVFSNGERKLLKRSPHKQSEESMRYFIDTYEKMYNKKFDGIYGFSAAFPFYIVDVKLLDHSATRATTIDARDMGNLKIKIELMFAHFKNKSHHEITLMKSDSVNMYNLINKSLTLGILKNRHIDQVNKQISEITRVQETLVHFLGNQNNAIVVGGAGTGKTYLAYKKASVALNNNKKVLFITLNKSLVDEAYSNTLSRIEDLSLIESMHLFSTMHDYCECVFLPDLVIVDEAQEYSVEDLSKLYSEYKKSNFYIFMDPKQSLNGKDITKSIKDIFNISIEPYLLSRNIRNTSNIIHFLSDNIQEEITYTNSLVSGSNPIVKRFKTQKDIAYYLNDIIKELIEDEKVTPDCITILYKGNASSIIEDIEFRFSNHIGTNLPSIMNFEDFKGLENDIVVFLELDETYDYDKYVAFTRARFMLYRVIFTPNVC